MVAVLLINRDCFSAPTERVDTKSDAQAQGRGTAAGSPSIQKNTKVHEERLILHFDELIRTLKDLIFAIMKNIEAFIDLHNVREESSSVDFSIKSPKFLLPLWRSQL